MHSLNAQPIPVPVRAQLPNLLPLPANAHQVLRPLQVLFLKILDGEWLRPVLDHVAGVGDHLLERLEGYAVVGDALPFVVHVDVELGAFKELESGV